MGIAAETESFWLLFALFSKCQSLSITNMICIVSAVSLFWLAMSIIFWSQPGGPAWGKYRLLHWSKRPAMAVKPIPMGPKGFPIIGSMNLMRGLAHHKIAAMVERCPPQAKRLMAFSLGETKAIVTCNPDVAKEILNSSVFADRPMKESAYSLLFNRAIGFAPYGIYWRTLRRIASTHMFCPKQIRATEPQRTEMVSQMMGVFGKNKDSGGFCVREVLRKASLGNMMSSVFGQSYDLVGDSHEELMSMVSEGYELLGKMNWGDHLSWISEFDFQRIRFRCSKLVPKVNRFVGGIIEEHRSTRTNDDDHPNVVNRDFVDVLLSLQGAEKLSDSDMIAVLWEMIFRGTDTVAVLIEWILARMVLHPSIQSKVQQELDKIVGTSRAVTESDTSSLVYLTAVIKEVLRLHPPGPLLSWARLSITDTTIDGYHVPAGTTAIVNMWAITRDPAHWSNPNEFKPERFLTATRDGVVSGSGDFSSLLGSDLKLAPFGSGRRSCPGKALGLTTVSFWVASLLHEFEWVGMESSGDHHQVVDLSEVLKLSCEMANPLKVQVRARRTTTMSSSSCTC